MAVSVIVKHWTDGKLTLKDGAGTPRTLELPFTIGDFQLSELKESMRETVVYQTRGTLRSLRKGAATFATGSFSAMLADYWDGTDETIISFLLDTGGSAANTSTTAALGDVYTLDLDWDIEGTDLGDAADHQVALTDCDCTFSLSEQEGGANMINVSFTVYGGAPSFT